MNPARLLKDNQQALNFAVCLAVNALLRRSGQMIMFSKVCTNTWFDGFFLSMLATSVIVVSVNWERYTKCTFPLHIWIVVDYASVFLFRVLMFVNNGLAAGMGPDASEVDRLARFKGRLVVIACLTFILYPFLWAWTVIGSLWFSDAKTCLPEEGQKWGFLIWLVFSYCGLICVACISLGQWQLRRQAHAHLVSAGSAPPISEFEILFELIRIPDWAFVSLVAGRETTPVQGGHHEFLSYHPGMYLTPAQREEVEKLIQELPTFRLKTIPADTSSCPICLEDFEIGVEVRGLPCAHNFHVACIDEWLRLNVKCPHCRCSVLPEVDFANDPPSPSQLPTPARRPVPAMEGTQATDPQATLNENTATQNGPSAANSFREEEAGANSARTSESVVIAVDRPPHEPI